MWNSSNKFLLLLVQDQQPDSEQLKEQPDIITNLAILRNKFKNKIEHVLDQYADYGSISSSYALQWLYNRFVQTKGDIYLLFHGKTNQLGDWVFTNEQGFSQYITWDVIRDLWVQCIQDTKRRLIIVTDSSFSGNWCVNLSQQNMGSDAISIFASCGPEEQLFDGGFLMTHCLLDDADHQKWLLTAEIIQDVQHPCFCIGKSRQQQMMPRIQQVFQAKLTVDIKKFTNLGKTGWMNSVLQCLIKSKGLTNYFQEHEVNQLTQYFNERKLNFRQTLCFHYFQLVSHLNNSSQNYEGLKNFNKTLNLLTVDNYPPKQLHNCQDFLVYMLRNLQSSTPILTTQNLNSNRHQIQNKKSQESWSRSLQSNKSIVSELFGVQLIQIDKCMVCFNQRTNFIQVLTSTVSIPQNKHLKLHGVNPVIGNRSDVTISIQLSTTQYKTQVQQIGPLSSNTIISQLRALLGKQANISNDRLALYLSVNGKNSRLQQNQSIHKLILKLGTGLMRLKLTAVQFGMSVAPLSKIPQKMVNSLPKIQIKPKAVEFKPTIVDCLLYMGNYSEQTNDLSCDKCEVLTQQSIKIEFYRLPEYLILGLQRYGTDTKNKQVVQLTQKFNFSKLCTYNPSSHDYQLYAVIYQQDDEYLGHCYAAIRIQSKWYKVNDTKIKQITVSQLSNQDAYILFYQRL